MENPFTINYGKEPVLFVFDQSSTCTGLTIGNKQGQAYEFITFERDVYRKETTAQYLDKLKVWVRALLQEVNCICFSTEKVILTKYYESDKVVKEVRGVLMNVYQSSHCKNVEGNKTLLANQARLIEINNKEWKSLIVPREAKKLHEKEKTAIHMFVCKFLPFLSNMKQDIADAVCMYLFLVKTVYGDQKLVANRSSISPNHHLVLLAFPYPRIGKANSKLASLGDTTLVTNPNGAQLEFLDKYRESVVKRYLALMSGDDYSSEYVEANINSVNNTIVKYIKMKPEDEYQDIQKFAKMFEWDRPNVEYKEIEFSDKMTLEENFRCFTNRDRNIYYTVVPRNLHYNYIIAMFNMKLEYDSDILVVGVKY